MPVSNFGSAIGIAHKVLNINHMVMEMGITDMSMELAIWLLAHAKSAETLGEGTFLQSSTTLRQMSERALTAATRGYRPMLADTDNKRNIPILTTHGQILANKLAEVIDVINEETDNSAWNPSQWNTADEMFIVANIPLRTVKLLNMFNMAILTTETKFANKMREAGITSVTPAAASYLYEFNIPILGGIDRTKNSETDKNPNKQYDTDKNSETDKTNRQDKNTDFYIPVMPSQIRAGMNNIRQEIAPNDCLLFQDGNAPHWAAWVPVSIFSPSTRVDMRYLYRFGLVDLRAFNSPGRGRPRLIVRPSIVGDKLLKDLEKNGHL